MKRLQRSAVILSLIEALLDRNGWSGETHIQKATYFLQVFMRVPLGFDFILYKHGPFSFDLRDELTAMQADEIIQLKARPPYGLSMIPGPNSERVKELFSKTLEKYKEQVMFVAGELGGLGVAELERVATAAYVVNNAVGDEKTEQRACLINKLKPHISIEEAIHSLTREKEIHDKAGRLAYSVM